MPLPLPILQAYLAASVSPAPPGDGESWVLVAQEPAGGPPLAKAGPRDMAELQRRLDQRKARWEPVALVAGGWRSAGARLHDLDRVGAVKLAHKLRRWAVLREVDGRRQVLYTGINDRARSCPGPEH